MEKIKMATPLVEMDGDDTDSLEDDKRGASSAICGFKYRVL